jgi:CO dehydrogenase maturation factor
MRIGFLGKGGSGKTTITAGFVRWLESEGASVLAIDGDVNAHLGTALDISSAPPPIGAHYEEIAAYVRGGRTDLGDRPLLSTTPPSPQSRFLACTDRDPLLNRFTVRRGTLAFMQVGGFTEADIGANCYHTKLHALCVILNHLRDSHEDFVVIDATAGVDTLSTALVAAYDLNLFVVEPTLKSIGVYRDFVTTDAESIGRTVVLINKVVDEQDIAFVRTHLPNAPIIGALRISRELQRSEQGDSNAFHTFVQDNRITWNAIREALVAHAAPWGSFEARLHDIHRKNCEWWYNAYYGKTLHTGLDRLEPPSE